MKTFTTSGTGSQQTLSPIETDKIPVYDSVTDAEADLANLEEGQLLTTKDTGSELSAPVDVVQSGNLHAVTSNAVAEAISLKAIESAFNVQDSDTKNLTLPSNYQFLVIVACTPYYAFTDIIPKDYITSNGKYVSYHSDPSGTQVFEYEINSSGRVSIARIIQNSSHSTGKMYCYYI